MAKALSVLTWVELVVKDGTFPGRSEQEHLNNSLLWINATREPSQVYRSQVNPTCAWDSKEWRRASECVNITATGRRIWGICVHKVTMRADNKVIKFWVNNSRMVKFACRPLLHSDMASLKVNLPSKNENKWRSTQSVYSHVFMWFSNQIYVVWRLRRWCCSLWGGDWCHRTEGS